MSATAVRSGLPDQIGIRCTILRGGTSKGVYLLANDVPPPGPARDRLLKRMMGTPDLLQIDGLGGARLITSKMAIVGRSVHPDADLDYTFAQVVPERDLVVYTSNCGNISAGVGPFAIDAGLVAASAPVTKVRIHNTNTGKILVAHVPVAGGRAQVNGDFAIDGVPGTGAEIRMDYRGTIGARTGRLLPTGRVTDEIGLEDGSTVTVSLCDAANPCLFIHAAEAGIEGGELPDDIAANAALLERLQEIRGKAARRIGLAADWRQADTQSPSLPLVVIVSAPAAYRTMRGAIVAPESTDLRARLVWYGKCHESMAGTGAICTAAATRIEGSVANQVLLPGAANASELRIGHPMGSMSVTVTVAPCNAPGTVEPCNAPGTVELCNTPSGIAFTALGFSRTARRIMDGMVYVPREIFDHQEQA